MLDLMDKDTTIRVHPFKGLDHSVLVMIEEMNYYELIRWCKNNCTGPWAASLRNTPTVIECHSIEKIISPTGEPHEIKPVITKNVYIFLFSEGKDKTQFVLTWT